jgi:DHA1 family multidrug resistance protein-like MFS transporter
VRAADGREPLKWHALFSLMSAMFAVAVGYGIVLPVLPFLVERLAQTTEPAALSRHTGLLTGTYTLALFLFAPLWGRASDRHGRRRVLFLGLGGFAVTLTLFALVDSLPLLYLGRFLSGLFASAVAPVVYAVVGDHAPTKEWRAHRFALLNIAGAAGFLIGPMVGGFALVAARQLFAEGAATSIPAPFFATSGLALLAGLIVWRFVPVRDRLQPERITTPGVRNDRTVLMRLLSISFVTALAVGAFEVGLSLRGKQVLDLNAYQIGMMFTECSLVMFVVQALVFSPLVRPDTTRHLFTPSLVILAAGLAAVPFANGYIMMTLAVALVAASAGILSPLATYWISLGAGETQGAELGRQTAAASLGQAVGSAAGGLLFDLAIVPNASFTLTALFVAAGLAASVGLPRRLEKLLNLEATNAAGTVAEKVRGP